MVFAIVACSLTDCVRFHPMPGSPDVSGTALAIGATAGVALLVFLVHILMSSDP